MDYDCSSLKEKSTFTRVRSVQEKSVPKFLRKVFYLLEENKHNEYASWSHDGAAILIKKPKEFAEKVLPCYFKHNNLASFVRQLNMYNFKKKKNYHYDHAYGHEMFQKGKIELLRKIQRKTAESGQVVLPKVEIPVIKNEEVEIDMDYLLQENLQYKRVHKTLNTQLQFIERKIKDVRTEVSTLQQQLQEQRTKEDFLKKVIKMLKDSYGSHNIQQAIEAVIEETNPVMESQDDNLTNSGALQPKLLHHSHNTTNISPKQEAPHFELKLNSSEENFISQAFNPFNSKKDLTMSEGVDCFQDIEHGFSAQSHLFADGFSKPQALLTHNDKGTKQTTYENKEQSSEDCTSNPDSYLSWYVEFEKNIHNPEKFLDVANKGFRGESELKSSFDSNIYMLSSSIF